MKVKSSKLSRAGFVLKSPTTGMYLQPCDYPTLKDLTQDINKARLFTTKEGTVRYCLRAGQTAGLMRDAQLLTNLVPVTVGKSTQVTEESFLFEVR